MDPNGDSLSYYLVSDIPDWVSWDSADRSFRGTPTDYEELTLMVGVSDGWGGSTTMSFLVVTGVKTNNAPYANATLTDQEAYRNNLFYYYLPEGAFIDPDDDKLYYLVSLDNGSYVPDWLSFEDAAKLFSGFPDSNSTDITVLIVADDHKGGSTQQTFVLSVYDVAVEPVSYMSLYIVSFMLSAFILLVIVCMIYKNCKCRKKRIRRKTDDGETISESDSDSDSFEEDDDICIEDAKPKNPFYFKKAMAKKEGNIADDPYSN